MSAYHPQQQTAIENSYLLIHVVRHQHPVAPLVSALSTDQRFNLEARSVHISPRTAMGAMYFEIYLRRQHVKAKVSCLGFHTNQVCLNRVRQKGKSGTCTCMYPQSA